MQAKAVRPRPVLDASFPTPTRSRAAWTDDPGITGLPPIRQIGDVAMLPARLRPDAERRERLPAVPW